MENIIKTSKFLTKIYMFSDRQYIHEGKLESEFLIGPAKTFISFV